MTAMVHVPQTAVAQVHPLITEADLLDDFFGALKASSRRTYRQRLQAFAAWMGVSMDQLPAALLGAGRGPANQLVLRYKGVLLTAKVAPSTINVTLSAIRSLVAMARTVGRVEWGVEIKGVKAEAYRDTAGPGVIAIRKLLAQAAAHPDSALVARNILIVRLTYDLALRCNELTTLDLAHVERDGAGSPVAVQILGKGALQRLRRTLPPASRVVMSAWLAQRGYADGSLIGLTNRGVAKALERLAAKAKIGHVRPHGLRHTSITVALQANNGNIAKTMDHSRHANPTTVMRYNDNRLNSAGAMADAVSELL